MSAKIKNHPKINSTSHHKHKPKNVTHKDFEKTYWPYLPMLLVLFIMLFMSIKSDALPSVTHKASSSKVLSASTDISAANLLTNTNAARLQKHENTLSLNDKLNAAAQAKANDMATRNYWSHVTPDGQQPWVFVTEKDYDYQALAENLATGFNNSSSTVKGWLASPEHKKNMLNKDYSEVGFGTAYSPDYTAAGGGAKSIVVAYYAKPASAVTFAGNTVAGSSNGQTLAYRTSHAQIFFANTSLSNFATGLAIGGMIAAACFWLSRHLLNLRKAYAYSQSFVIKHPLMDAGLIVIGALSYLLTQTAGFVK